MSIIACYYIYFIKSITNIELLKGGIMSDNYLMAATMWKEAEFPVAFTGAGISVPSGIPDFRSPGGLWTKYDPMEVATAEAIEKNPKKVWEFMLETADLLDNSKPNPAHYALAELEEAKKLMGIITQNIDNLHQRAGSKNVVEYHGNFQRYFVTNAILSTQKNK